MGYREHQKTNQESLILEFTNVGWSVGILTEAKLEFFCKYFSTDNSLEKKNERSINVKKHFKAFAKSFTED